MDVAAPTRLRVEHPEQQSPPRPADPCAFVIFGAAGDLTKRLLVPALYNLAATRLLPDGFAVIGVARGEMSDDEFRDRMGTALRDFATMPLEPDIVRDLLARFSYVRGDFDDPDTYNRLVGAIDQATRDLRTGGNCLFYLATPPNVFALIAQHLAAAKPDHAHRTCAGSRAGTHYYQRARSSLL